MPAPSSRDEFLTVAEVSELLKVNQQTVRNWVDRHELRAVRIGARRVRISRAELDAFIAAGATLTQAQADAGAEGEDRADHDESRAELVDALDDARRATADGDDDALAAALTALAAAADRLADALKA